MKADYVQPKVRNEGVSYAVGGLPFCGQILGRVCYDAGMDILAYNRAAWDRQVASGNRWTVPVGAEEVARARRGELRVVLTPTRVVPADWFPALDGLPTLCLASGGGQQGPLLAAAGARVTVFDNSPAQLAQDRLVAEREGLSLETVEGDMADLGRFADGSFGLIFHPCSNCFAPEVRSVWRECYRVLRPGGVLLAGFANPVRFLFPPERTDGIDLTVRYRIPFADERDLEAVHLQKLIDEHEPLAFGHTLDDQIGGQLDAGFVLAGFFEDRYDDRAIDPLSEYLATFVATKGVKPG
jgi:SAM-dependent methyltransferase